MSVEEPQRADGGRGMRGEGGRQKDQWNYMSEMVFFTANLHGCN